MRINYISIDTLSKLQWKQIRIQNITNECRSKFEGTEKMICTPFRMKFAARSGWRCARRAEKGIEMNNSNLITGYNCYYACNYMKCCLWQQIPAIRIKSCREFCFSFIFPVSYYERRVCLYLLFWWYFFFCTFNGLTLHSKQRNKNREHKLQLIAGAYYSGFVRSYSWWFSIRVPKKDGTWNNECQQRMKKSIHAWVFFCLWNVYSVFCIPRQKYWSEWSHRLDTRKNFHWFEMPINAIGWESDFISSLIFIWWNFWFAPGNGTSTRWHKQNKLINYFSFS